MRTPHHIRRAAALAAENNFKMERRLRSPPLQPQPYQIVIPPDICRHLMGGLGSTPSLDSMVKVCTRVGMHVPGFCAYTESCVLAGVR